MMPLRPDRARQRHFRGKLLAAQPLNQQADFQRRFANLAGNEFFDARSDSFVAALAPFGVDVTHGEAVP